MFSCTRWPCWSILLNRRRTFPTQMALCLELYQQQLLRLLTWQFPRSKLAASPCQLPSRSEVNIPSSHLRKHMAYANSRPVYGCGFTHLKIKMRKRSKWPIRKNFHPRKFPAMWYAPNNVPSFKHSSNSKCTSFGIIAHPLCRIWKWQEDDFSEQE